MGMLWRMAINHDDQMRKVRWANRRVRSDQVVIGEIWYEPGGFFGPRIQPDYQLVLVHSGGCRVAVDQQEFELELGRVHLFLPGRREHFHFSAQGQSHHSWCSVCPRFLPKDLRRELDRVAAGSVPSSKTFEHLLAAAFALRLPLDDYAIREINLMASCFFAEYLRLARDVIAATEADEPVRKARSYMAEHLGELDCLALATKICGVSRNALIYKFRQNFGLTPARYLWRLRVERGLAMLGETGHTVAEIAYQCGFKTPYHFSRLVRRFQGASPRDLRRQMWSAT